jgi:uncharacterized protein
MVMDVAHDSLVRLLDLQTEDSAIKRITERLDSLPEAKRLSEITDQLAELAADIEIATKQLDEITREHSKLEGEVGLADQKIAREEQRLFSGSVSNPKELGSLQSEVAMLKRKKGEIEDALLEVMVQKDQAAETRDRLVAEQATAVGEAAVLEKTVAGLRADAEAQMKEHVAKRDEIAAGIEDSLLKMYEQIRAAKGGVGVAALEAATCQGCHTKLPAKEIERIKAEGGLQRCDNCRRILVVV